MEDKLRKLRLDDLPSDAPHSTVPGIEPGRVLAERFEVIAKLGDGGMGEVYRARDRQSGVERAVKLMRSEISADPNLRRRFEREAEIAATLTHPNIVTTLGLHWHGSMPMISMELLDGHSLREEIHRKRAAGTRFSNEELRSIGRQIAAALEYAHGRIVHRDVKPDNIWVSSHGTIRLMDFGLSVRLEDRSSAYTNATVGTDRYAAPEQRRGDRTDARADQYSLAVVLYELAAGDAPSVRASPLRLLRSDLPAGFCAAVERALQTRPEDRFGTMAAFRGAMDARNVPWTRSRMLVAAAATVGVLTLATSPWWFSSVASVVQEWTTDRSLMAEIELLRTQAVAARSDYLEAVGDLPEAMERPTTPVGERLLADAEQLAAEGRHRDAIDYFKHAAANYESQTKDLLDARQKWAAAASSRGRADLNESARSGGNNEIRAIIDENPGSVFQRDKDGRYPLHHAVSRSDLANVSLLLERNADPNVADREGITPLHIAAYAGNEDLVKLLLEHGATPHVARLQTRFTPLHDAARRGHAVASKLLLDHGGNSLLSAESNQGDLPIHLAATHGHRAVLDVLLAAGASPNEQRKPGGDTPLILAVDARHTEIVIRLLREPSHAALNARGSGGRTALHWAAAHDDAEICDELIKHGADPAIADRSGKTPRDIAGPRAAVVLRRPPQ